MKTPAMNQRAKAIVIFSMLLLAVSGSLAAQSGTKDRVRKRGHRIFAAQTGPDQVTLSWDEIPGTTEYRIYLPDPNNPGPPAAGSRPTMSFSSSGRRATVTGVRRLAHGAYLEALGQGEVLYRGTFNGIARTPLASPTAPAAVEARETGETEVTLSWNPVPGATAYMIGRTVAGSGWQVLCDVCPPSGDFVDSDATPGLDHTYMVAAIFPLGISTRTPSNKLTVGAAQIAAAAASAPQAAVWDKPMSSGTPVSVTDANDSNVGAWAGTPMTITTTTTTGTTTTSTGTPTPSTESTSNPCTPLVAPKEGTAIIYTKMMASGTPVAGTDADYTNVGGSAGTIMIGSTAGCPTGTGTGTGAGTATSTTTSWTPGSIPAGSGTTAQQTVAGTGPVHNATPVTATPTATTSTTNNSFGGIAGQLPGMITQPPVAGTGPVHNATPVTATPTATTSTTNNPFGMIAGQLPGTLINSAGTPTGTPAQTTPIHAATPIAAPCKLDYQRADNMWAASGRPDGFLGVESISLANGQTKVFITDWAYEKQRNDGTNYYGSHLRLATNAGAGEILLRVRTLSTEIGGILTSASQNIIAGWLTIKPGVTQQLTADLMEVRCGQ